MAGDPVIRWQTMRDLLDVPEPVWQRERHATTTTGWVSKLLDGRGEDGHWPAARWTGDVWILPILIECGVPPSISTHARSVSESLAKLFPAGVIHDLKHFKTITDMCHLGFWLRIGAYFLTGDERVDKIAKALLDLQMEDGGWNCRIRTKPNTSHSSFHTTFNVLEGLRGAADGGYLDPVQFRISEARALRFMLAHGLYRSDKTGEVVDSRFLHLTFPSYWHYNVLRGLDYMRETPEIRDPLLADPLTYLSSRRRPDGRWTVEKRIPGVTLFDMEPMGEPSRWNTLRALRVLRVAEPTFLMRNQVSHE